MQNPGIINFPTSSEMELYRYLAAASGGCSGGVETDVMGLLNNHHNNNNHIDQGVSYDNNNNNNNNNNKSSYSGTSCCSSFYRGTTEMIMNEISPNDTKAIAASRILHKEAEKRRRERINSHLDRLRSLLPCTSKTDKATLLSKVVQRVLELKRQTSELPNLDNLLIPSQNDEFSVYILHQNDDDNEHQQQLILKASLCCEDRPDLLSDLSQVLTSLNMRPLRAEMSTLGGRIHGILIVSADNDDCRPGDECAVFLRDALKGIVQKSGSGSDDRLKRRRRMLVS